MTDNTNKASPGLKDLVKETIADAQGQTRTVEVGRVVKYDESDNSVDVKPVMKGEQADGSAIDRGIIPNLKVAYPQGGGWSIVWPLSKGDRVIIEVLTRPHNKFFENGVEGELPSYFSRFNLGDSIVHAGVRPFSDPLENGGTDKMVIGQEDSDGAKITLNEAGDITINVPDGKKVNVGDSTASKALAMAESVASRLNDFKDSYDGHGHPYDNGVTGRPSDASTSTLGRPFTSTSADELAAKHAEDNKGDNAL